MKLSEQALMYNQLLRDKIGTLYLLGRLTKEQYRELVG